MVEMTKKYLEAWYNDNNKANSKAWNFCTNIATLLCENSVKVFFDFHNDINSIVITVQDVEHIGGNMVKNLTKEESLKSLKASMAKNAISSLLIDSYFVRESWRFKEHSIGTAYFFDDSTISILVTTTSKK